MRVLIAPFFQGNQYLRLLAAHLEDDEVEVERSTGARPLALPIVDVLRTDADVFHLHWTHPYFLFGSYEWLYRVPFVKYACWAFATFFVTQVYLATHLTEGVVWTVHNKCNHERRYETMDRWVSRRVFRLSDVVQVWDENTRDELVEYLDVPDEKIVQIPHGNYLPLYPEETWPTVRDARDALGLQDGTRVFLYFGMIRPYKRVPSLIESFVRLDPSDAVLVIAGRSKHPRLSARIHRLAAGHDSVKTDLRYIPDEEVPTYFRAADVAVFPYEDIFSSGSVLLAMSLGTPFVAPAFGAIPNIAPEGNVLYRSLDVGLAEACGLEPERLQSVGSKNLRAARAEHNWSAIGERTRSMYESVASSARLGE